MQVGGIAQPQFVWWDSDNDKVVAQPKSSGFVLKRARLFAGVAWESEYITLGAKVEAEMTPQFSLLDAFVYAQGQIKRGNGAWRLEAGQTFAPFSRQTITSVANLQMLDFAQLVQLAPGRQIGGMLMLAVPYAPWLQLSFGAFNGEGPNVAENVDNHAMYVARVAFRPVNPYAPLQESAFTDTAVWFAGHFSHNVRNRGDFEETQILAGADAYFCWRGLSAYAEYLWGQSTYTEGAPKQSFVSQGFNLQVGYLLPIPGRLYRRFELAARFEAIAPNQTVPIESAGDATQARASYGGGIHYYHKGHSAKIGLEYYHNQELDETDRVGRDATYSNDTVLVQITYRLE